MTPYVTIGVDPATGCSGWAIRVGKKLVGYGEIRNLEFREIDKVIRAAETFAEIGAAEHGCALPLAIMFVHEKPLPGNIVFQGRTPESAAGVERAIGEWRSAWLRIGYNQRRFVGVRVNDWRRDVFGKGWGAGGKREQIKQTELLSARAHAAEAALAMPVGPDSAPAILISHWGACSPLVQERLLPRSKARRRGRAA